MKTSLKINWEKGNGLVPAVIQDAGTDLVLMVGYMNQEALQKSLETKKIWFYSRTKKRLWMKGEKSGHVLKLVEIRTDCDADALLVKAVPAGPTCHTGKTTCFSEEPHSLSILSLLYKVIEQRKRNKPQGSYTSFLFSKGTKKICEKVREESGEVIKAATKETKARLIEESVDLLYHLFVLLVQKKVKLKELLLEVQRRRKP